MKELPSFYVPKSEAEARAIQEELRSRTSLKNDFGTLSTIAGIDVGYDNSKGLAHAAITLLCIHKMEVLEHTQVAVPVDFPYIPGLLSFREIPAILAALASMKRDADIFMIDGQGIAHPRRMGIAAHLGTLLDKPSIGVAKSRLSGRFEMPETTKGSMSALMLGKERIGTVLRSRDNVMPLFISPGHRVDIKTATQITINSLRGYRLPEPTRLADKLSKVKKSDPTLL